MNERPDLDDGTEPTGKADSADSAAGAERDDLVRAQAFDAEGPLDVDVDITVGSVEIKLGGDGDCSVTVRHDPTAGAPWTEGVSNLLNWVGERFGSQLGNPLGAEFNGSPAEAVQQARIEKTGNRLVVRAAKPLPLRNVPLAVTITAPSGSNVKVHTGSANITVAGATGRIDLATGSGYVSAEQADGAATVRTGSGSVRLGPVPGGLQLRSGSGDVEVGALGGSATVATGTGDVWLGATSGQVLVRTSSGSLTVADAAEGSIEATTGAGNVRVGVRTGVAAEIELSSGSGQVASELDVAEAPPAGAVPLSVRARTGSGDAVVSRAAS
ncbi:hypothetical protein BAY61_10495 [Prauserella marina]|uniref:Putative adhesin n=1 Tax=Prauserella marina TaxID=530584 RepID=A0A222VNM4_9PSEU|nr:DUF4097 family beta strand repeat-containing protein [Prauserella marina]ASR35353.1 hypothetical protein BAY61_10495 [Prauserella marina]PWV84855.1 hypothetical protein DES30_101873 [Prauserella marina]SDC11338.1 Putative adhesin [Prauserella marina]